MNLTTDLIQGLISALIGLGFGSAIFVLGRGRVEDALIVRLEDYAAEKLQEIQENPQILSKMLKPVFSSMLKDITGSDGSKPPAALKIGGFKIPAELYMPVAMRLMASMQNGATDVAVSAVKGALEP